MIPRWYKQPEYVEIWVEKNAMAGVFSSVLTKSRQVRIVPNGGWSSESFMKDNLNRLRFKMHDEWDEKRKIRRFKDAYVLYYGDYDPSGSRMVQNLKEALDEIGVEFEHVAITKEQIERFGLQDLTNPDSAD